MRCVLEDEAQQELSMYYISEAARLLTENMAKQTGGTYLTKPLHDIINKKPEIAIDGEKLVDNILNKICGKESE